MDQRNIDDVFSQMLGELDGITQELDEITIAPEVKKPAPVKYDFSSPRNSGVDNQVNDFDEEDVNLTAMLNDLCSFEENISQQHPDASSFGASHNLDLRMKATLASQPPMPVPPPPIAGTTPTPQYSPMLQQGAAESLEALSAAIDQDQQQPAHKELTEEELALLSPEEREDRIRSEKVRIALEKMKEARIQKLVVKVHNKDNSSKTMVIDERMTTRDVMVQLIEKNHYDYSANWALVEEMPSLFLERMCEEHEKPCETMKYWTRSTTNQLRFLERKDKYALFKNPQHFLLTSSDQQEKMAERQKQTLIEEFFSGKGPSSGVPEVQGFLHIKNGKSWSRKYCVLRSSGLYVSKTGEPKKGKKLADLVCLVMFEQTYLYIGRGWKKKFKAPFEYGFALKHPAFQTKSKHVRYLACEDFKSLMRWTVGIRLAKYGRDLLIDYEKTNEEVKSQSSVPALKITYRHEQAPDSISVKSNDSAESRASSLPRPVGVKNMFEGAWQRANQADKPIQDQAVLASPSINSTRTKSTVSTNQKKMGNWWESKDDRNETAPASEPSPSHSIQTAGAPHEVATTSANFPPPPPPSNSFPAPPASNFAPPPVSPKPPNSTFTSFDDPLPPPPPMMASSAPVPPLISDHAPHPSTGSFPLPQTNREDYKPPPPAVPPKTVRSPQHAYDNSIGRTAF